MSTQDSPTTATMVLLEELNSEEWEPLLLHPEQQKRQRTPLPKLQLAVVLLLEVTECISLQAMDPFINQASNFDSL
jgi:hypothetical protein